ncbi:MAG: hypothetical protein F6K23_37955 [Okeania sp. SIO2C9]|uniref:hypothetical protein n=1 Tax=Okeania sp. SIO2C9 TaxID=2607791 RepID=UPI0013BFA3AA|nr:hypothetical protein [Okeania sp. SIO2C9]NEQ78272.1 hypothetical protein [Okeania sp. SIO2C9]
MSNLDPEKEAKTVDKAILKQIDSLKKEDERLYNILAIDVWALAKTMDEFQPGFWAAFMKNRDKALKNFMAYTVKNKQKNDRSPPFLH